MEKSKKDQYVRFRIDEATNQKVVKIRNVNGCSKSDIYREAIELLITEKYSNILMRSQNVI